MNRFDIYELPEGHQARFLRRLDGRTDRRLRIIRFASWSAAAAVAAAFMLIASRQPFFGARTPEAVYTAYLEEVGKLYESFVKESDGDSPEWSSSLESLTEENQPMYEQLTDDLSEKEKTAILKQHYGRILDGAEELRSQMKKQ